MRRVLQVAGWLAVAIGLVWAAQGSGYFPYPAASFMINQTPWIGIGLAVAAAGLVAVVLSRRF